MPPPAPYWNCFAGSPARFDWIVFESIVAAALYPT